MCFFGHIFDFVKDRIRSYNFKLGWSVVLVLFAPYLECSYEIFDFALLIFFSESILKGHFKVATGIAKMNVRKDTKYNGSIIRQNFIPVELKSAYHSLLYLLKWSDGHDSLRQWFLSCLISFW